MSADTIVTAIAAITTIIVVMVSVYLDYMRIKTEELRYKWCRHQAVLEKMRRM